MEQSVVMLPTAFKKQIKLLSREKSVSVAELLWQALAEVPPQTELDRLQAKLATTAAALDGRVAPRLGFFAQPLQKVHSRFSAAWSDPDSNGKFASF